MGTGLVETQILGLEYRFPTPGCRISYMDFAEDPFHASDE
jgi:hypothetical protein